MARPKKDKDKLPWDYLPADDSFIVNNDPDLRPIRISLPKPPDLKLIDGYGLEPKDQRFRRVEEPPRLTALIEQIKEDLNKKAKEHTLYRITGYKLQQEIWERLTIDPERYEPELKWIKKQWWHKIHGYWFFNNGKPTYICGWNYAYLNFWYIPSIKAGGYPQFRERDRKWFLFNKYIYDCTETFEKIDKNGRPIKEEDGTYRMIDTGKRMFFGTMNNKHRRAGDTNKTLCIGHELLMLNPGTYAGIISYTGDHAKDQFKKILVPAWAEYPLYLKPFFSSSNDPGEDIVYNVPPNEFIGKGINSSFKYSTTGTAKMFDGKKVCFLDMEEAGKDELNDINEKHATVRLCMAQGKTTDIFGFCVYPSTVEELTEKGGEAFRKMAEKSNFYLRVPEEGNTVTGLALQFYPSDDCLEGYIDSYGQRIEDNPLPHQKEEGFKRSARKYLQGEQDYLLRMGDVASINSYRENQRKFPLRYSDSWIGSTGNIGFDILKIDKRIAEIESNSAELMPTRGNFIGTLTDPIWIPDDNGRFYVSYMPPVSERNQKIRTLEVDALHNVTKPVWKPAGVNGYVKFTAGGDAFNYLKEAEARKRDDGSKTSKGGGAVFMNRDKKIDPDEKPKELWETYRFVCTYLYRPSTDDEYVDDMIRMCVWFGAYMYPETNKELLWKEFEKRGFGGYLSYDIDPNTGRRAERPGIYLQKQKEDVFKLFQSYIYYRCHNERHIELLEDAKNISSIDRLTDYDRLAASMEALWGSRNNFNEVMSFTSNGVCLADLGRALSR